MSENVSELHLAQRWLPATAAALACLTTTACGVGPAEKPAASTPAASSSETPPPSETATPEPSATPEVLNSVSQEEQSCQALEQETVGPNSTMTSLKDAVLQPIEKALADGVSTDALPEPASSADALQSVYGKSFMKSLQEANSAGVAQPQAIAQTLVNKGFADATAALGKEPINLQYIPAGLIVVESDRDYPGYQLSVSLGPNSEYSEVGRTAVADGDIEDIYTLINPEKPGDNQLKYVLIPKPLETSEATTAPCGVESAAPSPSASPSHSSVPQHAPVKPSPSAAPKPYPTQPAQHTGPLTRKEKWEAATYAVLRGFNKYIDRMVAGHPGKKLAVNSDVDDTALASTFNKGRPVEATLEAFRYAKSKGVDILFNTARQKQARSVTTTQLRRAGYPVDDICLAENRGAVVENKQRCRRNYVRMGYLIIANVGNHTTDFTGGNYLRGFRLPDHASGQPLK